MKAAVNAREMSEELRGVRPLLWFRRSSGAGTRIWKDAVHWDLTAR
jgi:hypothetical protein